MVHGVLQAWAYLLGVDTAGKPSRAYIGGQNAVRGVQWAGAARDQALHHSAAAHRRTAARADRSQHVHKLAVGLQSGQWGECKVHSPVHAMQQGQLSSQLHLPCSGTRAELQPGHRAHHNQAVHA